MEAPSPKIVTHFLVYVESLSSFKIINSSTLCSYMAVCLKELKVKVHGIFP